MISMNLPICEDTNQPDLHYYNLDDRPDYFHHSATDGGIRRMYPLYSEVREGKLNGVLSGDIYYAMLSLCVDSFQSDE